MKLCCNYVNPKHRFAVLYLYKRILSIYNYKERQLTQNTAI